MPLLSVVEPVADQPDQGYAPKAPRTENDVVGSGILADKDRRNEDCGLKGHRASPPLSNAMPVGGAVKKRRRHERMDGQRNPGDEESIITGRKRPAPQAGPHFCTSTSNRAKPAAAPPASSTVNPARPARSDQHGSTERPPGCSLPPPARAVRLTACRSRVPRRQRRG